MGRVAISPECRGLSGSGLSSGTDLLRGEAAVQLWNGRTALSLPEGRALLPGASGIAGSSRWQKLSEAPLIPCWAAGLLCPLGRPVTQPPRPRARSGESSCSCSRKSPTWTGPTRDRLLVSPTTCPETKPLDCKTCFLYLPSGDRSNGGPPRPSTCAEARAVTPERLYVKRELRGLEGLGQGWEVKGRGAIRAQGAGRECRFGNVLETVPFLSPWLLPMVQGWHLGLWFTGWRWSLLIGLPEPFCEVPHSLQFRSFSV